MHGGESGTSEARARDDGRAVEARKLHPPGQQREDQALAEPEGLVRKIHHVARVQGEMLGMHILGAEAAADQPSWGSGSAGAAVEEVGAIHAADDGRKKR